MDRLYNNSISLQKQSVKYVNISFDNEENGYVFTIEGNFNCSIEKIWRLVIIEQLRQIWHISHGFWEN
ncbi:MAG: hypothetical protein RBR27_05765, partial [Bacilli bacterium]|nr:hypothetical protein [Bacilli bacterium]